MHPQTHHGTTYKLEWFFSPYLVWIKNLSNLVSIYTDMWIDPSTDPFFIVEMDAKAAAASFGAVSFIGFAGIFIINGEHMIGIPLLVAAIVLSSYGIIRL